MSTPLSVNAIYGVFARAKSPFSPGGEKVTKPELAEALAIAKADGTLTTRERHAVAYNISFALGERNGGKGMTASAYKLYDQFAKETERVYYPVDDSFFARAGR